MAKLRNYHRWIFEEIRTLLGRRTAEIGGGIGTFSREIANGILRSDPGSSLEVFEPAPGLYDGLLKTFRHCAGDLMETGRLTAVPGYFQPSRNRYDSVVMVNVLEHVEDEDPLFGNIYRSLESGGTLIVFVPALRRLYSPLDKEAGHYRRYEKKDLSALFERNGFSVIKEQYMDVAGIIPWYLINVIGRSRSFNPSLAALYDRLGIPLTRCLERSWGAPIGKNLLMAGRKLDPA